MRDASKVRSISALSINSQQRESERDIAWFIILGAHQSQFKSIQYYVANISSDSLFISLSLSLVRSKSSNPLKEPYKYFPGKPAAEVSKRINL